MLLGNQPKTRTMRTYVGPAGLDHAGLAPAAAIAASSTERPMPGSSPRMSPPSAIFWSRLRPKGVPRSWISIERWFGTDAAACAIGDAVADRADRQISAVRDGCHAKEVRDTPGRVV